VTTKLINEKRYAIENAIITLMAVQAPKARDLRLMAAFLEVITELERYGRLCQSVAKVTRLLEDGTISTGMREFAKMGNHSVDMLHRALSAFINQDAHAAYQILPKMSRSMRYITRFITIWFR